MKTVITYGVFDLFHEGHVSLLKRAKELGDRLIVGVTTDQFAYKRGKYSVIDPVEKRFENVRSCPYVDQVIIEDHYGQKVEDIARFGVDIFAIGDDWLGKFDHLSSLCRVVYLKRTPNKSSTELRCGSLPFLRLGMIGCGRIAGRFMQEAGYVRDVQVTSLYHPSPDTSATVQRFREKHTGIGLARTLDKLFDLTDAVYIASPHGTHFRYAKEALLAGRHVLCEKPLALSKDEAEELVQTAEDNRCVLMEAVKTAYCPGFLELISLVRSGEIGEVYDIESCFTRLTPANTREFTDVPCGGSLTEFGSYTLLPILKIYGTEGLRWSFETVRDSRGVDVYTKVLVRKGDRMASAKNGLSVKSKSELLISGTKGFITVEAPWWKTAFMEVGYEDPARRKRFCFDFEGDGLRYEIADFLYRIRGYGGREYKLLPEESIKMAEIMGDFLSVRGDQLR